MGLIIFDRLQHVQDSANFVKTEASCQDARFLKLILVIITHYNGFKLFYRMH